MKAGLASSVDSFAVQEIAPTGPGLHDVVVAVSASGICASDHSVLVGHMPFPLPLVLGHELAGRVVEVGAAVTRVRVGDRVIGTAVPQCGRCWWCLRGLRYLCGEAERMWGTQRYTTPAGSTGSFCGLGSFAESTTVDELSVVPVQTDLPDDQLALIGCGIITGAGAVFNTAKVKLGDEVAVFGLGGVGLAIVQAAALSGAARIFAIDPIASKRQAAVDLGATDGLDSALGADVVSAIQERTGGRGVDVAFEAAGRVDTTMYALRATRRAGTFVAVGAVEAGALLNIEATELAAGGKKITSSPYGGSNVDVDFPMLVGLAETGRLNVGRLVSKHIPLESEAILAAFDDNVAIRTVRSWSSMATKTR